MAMTNMAAKSTAIPKITIAKTIIPQTRRTNFAATNTAVGKGAVTSFTATDIIETYFAVTNFAVPSKLCSEIAMDGISCELIPTGSAQLAGCRVEP